MPQFSHSPIFVKTYDLLVWLLQHTRKYPKDQRFVLAKRMEDAALDMQDALLVAGKTRQSKRQATALHRADEHLDRLKLYARLSHDLKLCSTGQYEHLSRALVEVGRLLGAWLKQVHRPDRRGDGVGQASAATGVSSS